MCYGQTGAGKTFTMTGARNDYKYRGIIPRMISNIFQEIGNRYEHQIKVYVSYLELYNETLIDLLTYSEVHNMSFRMGKPFLFKKMQKDMYLLKDRLWRSVRMNNKPFKLYSQANQIEPSHNINSIKAVLDHILFLLFIFKLEARYRVHRRLLCQKST